MNRRKNQKVVKMKRRNSYLTGTFLCIFAIYVLVLFIQSFTKEHVSIYEVNQNQLADNENLRGMILRDEEIITATDSGYINYYVGEGSRLAATTTVYSVDEFGDATQETAAMDTTNVTLSEDDTRKLRGDIANFRNHFNLSDYSGIVNFHYNIENTLLELSDINLAQNLSKLKKESGSGSSFQLVKAKQTGIISFSSDGLENLTIDEVTPEHFEEMTDQWEQLRTGESVEKGSPVYRVINSEKWSIVVLLTKEQFVKLSQKDTAVVKIKKDNSKLKAKVRTFTSDGNYYVNLVFDKYMIHYLNNRYLDIEILFDNAEGLKIPVSSIIKKNCYVIPEEYITEGTGTQVSNKKGLVSITYSKAGEEEYNFIPADIYWKDENGRVYVDASLLEPGATIALADGNNISKMQVTQIQELEGVYNCNQGYCKFQYINKLYENEEYAIIEKGNVYSLSNYDHIILNPKLINEDDIIY